MLTAKSHITLIILSVTTDIAIVSAVLMTLALYLIDNKNALNMVATVADSSTDGIISLMPEGIKTLIVFTLFLCHLTHNKTTEVFVILLNGEGAIKVNTILILH